MNCLGIDYGERRIGLACGDTVLGLALPVPAATAERLKNRFQQIEEVIRARGIQRIVVGYPLNMDGSVGFKAREVDVFIESLEARFKLPVERVDERLTSEVAKQGIAKPKRRSIKQQIQERKSGSLDSRAAAVILQDWLDQYALAKEQSLP